MGGRGRGGGMGMSARRLRDTGYVVVSRCSHSSAFKRPSVDDFLGGTDVSQGTQTGSIETSMSVYTHSHSSATPTACISATIAYPDPTYIHPTPIDNSHAP